MPASATTRRIIRTSRAVILLLAIAVSGCGERVKGEIVQQLPRPGEGVTAILTIDRGSFVTSHVHYDVYLKFDRNGSVDHVFSARDGAAVKIRWQTQNTLIVAMPCGEIGFYKNTSWYSPGNLKVFVGLEGNQPCNPDVPVPRVRNNELVQPR